MEIKSTVSGYELTWVEEKINIKVSRLDSHSDGRVTGELLIRDDEGKVLYPPTSFNFNADRTRSSLAKSLTEQDESRDWASILKQLCLSVIEHVRTGQPIQELWTSEEIIKPRYLVGPIMLEGLPTIIFGEKGVAKSTISQILYLTLSLPWYDNPLELAAPSEPVKTLILDWEVPGKIAQWNLKQLQEGMGLPAVPLYHRKCFLPLADDIETIKVAADKMGAQAFIIDSLARAAGGDLNKDTDRANKFFEALDKLGGTSLTLGQTSKDQDSKKKSIYGNAMFTYYFRSIFEMCKCQEPGEDTLDVALFHRWSNLTKLESPMGFHIHYNGAGTKIERQPVDFGEFREKITGQMALFDFLKSGDKSIAEISKELGWAESSVRVLLSKLKKKGKVVNIEHGQWGLALEKT